MAIPKIDKHTQYARYAAHCLNMMNAPNSQDDRSVRREMAAEWLKLADAILRRVVPVK
jgi:hypothetical protein